MVVAALPTQTSSTTHCATFLLKALTQTIEVDIVHLSAKFLTIHSTDSNETVRRCLLYVDQPKLIKGSHASRFMITLKGHLIYFQVEV